MSKVKSDIQIAREAKMQPIKEILEKVNVPDESFAFSPMGRHIAKINLVETVIESLPSGLEGPLLTIAEQVKQISACTALELRVRTAKQKCMHRSQPNS